MMRQLLRFPLFLSSLLCYWWANLPFRGASFPDFEAFCDSSEGRHSLWLRLMCHAKVGATEQQMSQCSPGGPHHRLHLSAVLASGCNHLHRSAPRAHACLYNWTIENSETCAQSTGSQIKLRLSRIRRNVMNFAASKCSLAPQLLQRDMQPLKSYSHAAWRRALGYW